MKMTLYLIVDPMCSWCWGFSSVWHALREELPSSVQIIDLMGGLAQDTDQPMDESTRQYVQNAWRTVASRTSALFNFEFWETCKPRRTTYPACRAVIAAGLQDRCARSTMYEAIQRGYFLEARNPSDTDTLIAIAHQIGIDSGQFARDLEAPQTQKTFAGELATVRTFGVTGFPTVIWRCEEDEGNSRYGLLCAGYTDTDSLRARWAELIC